MKSYKQFKQELNEKVSTSFSAAPSVSDGDFSSIRGLGLNTGDSITANLPGDKGRTKGKTDIRPDITRAIESGKKTGFIEEDENGKLSYRGADGKLHNSPYAALEASTSFTKNVLVSSGVDGDLATKGSEAFSSLLKSGYISYDHKKGKVYVGDDEIDSFDTGSEKSMNNITKTLPFKIFRSIYKSYLTPLQVKAKKAITRGNREASKKFQTAVTNINSLMKRIDGLSEDDVKTLMPFFVGNMINTQEMMNQSSDPPVIILPKGRRPVGDPIDPPGPGGPPKELDPKYFYPNGTPRIRPGARNPQWGKPWATPETDRMRPQLRQGPDGPYWYTPPDGIDVITQSSSISIPGNAQGGNIPVPAPGGYWHPIDDTGGDIDDLGPPDLPDPDFGRESEEEKKKKKKKKPRKPDDPDGPGGDADPYLSPLDNYREWMRRWRLRNRRIPGVWDDGERFPPLIIPPPIGLPGFKPRGGGWGGFGRFRQRTFPGIALNSTPAGQQAAATSTAVKNFIKEVENTLVSLQTAKVVDQMSQNSPDPYSPDWSIPPRRPGTPLNPNPPAAPDPGRPGWWRKPTTPWFQPPDYQGPPRNLDRPNLDVENPDSLPPTTRDPRDIWEYWRKLYGDWPLPPWLVWDIWNQPDGGPYDRWGNPIPIPPWVPPTEPRPKKLPDGRRYWPGWRFPITPPPGWADDPNPPTEVPPGASPDGYNPGRYLPKWRRDPDAINPPGTPKPPSPYPPLPPDYDPDAEWNQPGENPWWWRLPPEHWPPEIRDLPGFRPLPPSQGGSWDRHPWRPGNLAPDPRWRGVPWWKNTPWDKRGKRKRT